MSRPPVTTPANDQRPLGMDRPRRVKALILARSMLAMFMSALEQGIVGPALPRIVSELGGLELYPWLFQACITARVVAIPVAAIPGNFALGAAILTLVFLAVLWIRELRSALARKIARPPPARLAAIELQAAPLRHPQRPRRSRNRLRLPPSRADFGSPMRNIHGSH